MRNPLFLSVWKYSNFNLNIPRVPDFLLNVFIFILYIFTAAAEIYSFEFEFQTFRKHFWEKIYQFNSDREKEKSIKKYSVFHLHSEYMIFEFTDGAADFDLLLSNICFWKSFYLPKLLRFKLKLLNLIFSRFRVFLSLSHFNSLFVCYCYVNT